MFDGEPFFREYLAHKKLPTPLGLPKGPRYVPTVRSQAADVSYERGTPVMLVDRRGHVSRDFTFTQSHIHSKPISHSLKIHKKHLPPMTLQ